MQFLKILVKSLLFLLVILAVVGFFLPSSTVVSRGVDISAPASKVFNYVNDFKQFNRWSPWTAKDPAMTLNFAGPATGVGSKMSWKSDESGVGNGSQEITASVENQSVSTHLEFDGQGNADASFELVESGGGTRITWGFESDWGYNILGRYMGLMMDRWVGSEYEKGLNSLKQLAESE